MNNELKEYLNEYMKLIKKFNENEIKEILNLLDKNKIINFYEYEILYYTLFKVNILSNFYKNKLNEIFNLILLENEINKNETYLKLNYDYKFYNEFYNTNIKEYSKNYYINIKDLEKIKSLIKNLILKLLDYE